MFEAHKSFHHPDIVPEEVPSPPLIQFPSSPSSQVTKFQSVCVRANVGDYDLSHFNQFKMFKRYESEEIMNVLLSPGSTVGHQ